MGFLRRFESHTFAALRIVAGFLYACHGAQKLFGVLGGEAQTAPLMITAGVIEFFGGVLIALGFLTAYVAFLTSGQMAAAYFMAHAPRGFWPIQNGGELAALYCFLFLFIAAHGAGPFSIDGMRSGRQAAPAGGAATS